MRASWLALGAIFCAMISSPMIFGPAAAAELAVPVSPRPESRPLRTVALVPGLRPAPRPQSAAFAAPRPTDTAMEASPGAEAGFRRWLAEFRDQALRQGITARTYARCTADIHFDPEVIRRDRNQSEFNLTIWDYLDRTVSAARIAKGREALHQYGSLLRRIQDRYGVDPAVVVAIWGMESNYGNHRGSMPVIQSLASLAYDSGRAKFFATQLVDAMKIVQDGDISPSAMTGSWAGAMGHTQFIPSSYLRYAVDFSGDGKRDIWSNDPTDALASTAAYLAANGWRAGAPWGIEVRLPQGFDYSQSGHRVTKSPAQWAALGLRPAHGGALPDAGAAQLLLPAGAQGAAFLVFHNFHVIGRYNAADAYVLAVGYLADRIKGGPPIAAHWPRQDRALTRAEKIEMQERLTRAGFDTRGADGRIGPNTIAALRAYQRSIGMAPDGYPSIDVLKHLR